MTAPAIRIQDLTAAAAAIERVLADDRAKRVQLPADTYMALLRASGTLSAVLQRLDVQVPVTTE